MNTRSLTHNPVGEINQLHAEICDAASTIIEKAIRIGQLLTEQKTSLKHGEWLPWLSGNVQFNERTAQRYMRVFSNRDQLKSDTVSYLTDIYKLLEAPKKKDPDKQLEDLQYRIWKLECAWRAIEAIRTEDFTERDMHRLVAIIRDGNELVGHAREYTIQAERELGQLLTEARWDPLVSILLKLRDEVGHPALLKYCKTHFGEDAAFINELILII